MFGSRQYNLARKAAISVTLGATWVNSMSLPSRSFAGEPTIAPVKSDADCCKIKEKPTVDIKKFFDALKTSNLEVLKDGENDKDLQDSVTVAEVIKRNGDKPTIILSMGSVCPHAIKAEKFYNVLFDALKDTATSVIVFNGTVEQAREFKNKTSLTALVICDPKCHISYEGSPLERSSTSAIFVGGKPRIVPEGTSSPDLTNLSVPCSEAGFRFLIQSVVPDKEAQEKLWKQVDEKIGKDLWELTYHYGCPSAPQ